MESSKKTHHILMKVETVTIKHDDMSLVGEKPLKDKAITHFLTAHVCILTHYDYCTIDHFLN